jgi:hypothetical protein
MDADLLVAVDLVLSDLQATCAVQARVEERAGLVWFLEANDHGTGMALVEEMKSAERVADVADRASDWAVEALNSLGLSATWPECPLHPRSHPLQAEIETGSPNGVATSATSR